LELPPGLVQQARLGDAQARTALVEIVWPHAYRIALSVLCREDLALEAAQDAAAHLLTHLRDLRRVEAFPAWLYRLALHSAYSVARREQRLGSRSAPLRQEPDGSYAIPDQAVRAGNETEVDVRDMDRLLDLRNAVDRLREPLRTTFLLRYGADLQSEDVARILAIPAGTVRYRLAVARRLLREALGPEYGDATADQRGHPASAESGIP